MKRVLPSCSSMILAAAVVFSLPAAMASASRFSGGVRISPQNTGVMAGPITYSINGEQYVAVLAGWGGVFPLATGEVSFQSGRVKNVSRILVFKLGGTANLPAPDSAPSLPPPSPLPNGASETTIKLGEQKYQRYCAACHGDVAVSGGVLPDLRYSGTLDNNAWFSVVLGGILQPQGMVSFVKELSRRDASDIRSYVILRRNQSVAANKIPNKN